MYDRTLDPCVPMCERTTKEERKKKNWKNSVEETKAKGNAEETRKFVRGWTSGGQFRESMCVSFVHTVNKQQKIDRGEHLLNIRVAMTAVAQRRIYLGRAG